MKLLLFALIALSTVSTPEEVGVSSAASDYLRPVLKSIGEGARINYAGVCPGERKLHFPTVEVQPASPGSTGIAAVRQIFRNDSRGTVTQDQSGILSITIGSVSTSALQTKIPALTLNSASQYTPLSAVVTISNALETHTNGNAEPASAVIDIIVSGPQEGAPHLPPLMRNVSVDDALDSVARTFKGIVLYGACTEPDGKELFSINYIDGS